MPFATVPSTTVPGITKCKMRQPNTQVGKINVPTLLKPATMLSKRHSLNFSDNDKSQH